MCVVLAVVFFFSLSMSLLIFWGSNRQAAILSLQPLYPVKKLDGDTFYRVKEDIVATHKLEENLLQFLLKLPDGAQSA
jgi:hypothetical protein